jgi:hypothetical protein
LKYWLVEVNGKSGALWGFLVKATLPTAPAVIKQLKALGSVVEISGQSVSVADLNLDSVTIRYDATDRHTAGDRYLLEGRTVSDS